MPMAGRVVLVTGGGRGIGAAVVRTLAAQGDRVAFTWRGDAAAARATAAAAGALALQADVGDAAAARDVFAAVAAQLGPLEGLVNNAGITGAPGRVADTPEAVWEEVFRINVLGTAHACREAVRRMSTAHGSRGGGIVNLSSRAAAIGGAGEWVHYAASKGAIDALTLGLAREVAAEGIRVNAVAPGLVDTEIHAAAGMPDRVARMGPSVPLGRAGTAEEVAQAVVWLLSDAAAYITGAVLPVGGGR